MKTSQRTKRLLIIIGVIWSIDVLLITMAAAMPPHPDLLRSPDPLARRNIALYDSLRHHAGIDQPTPLAAGAAGTAVTGSRKLLVILVRFTDHDSSVTATYFDSLLFNRTTQTVWDYFNEVSYGLFSVDAVDLPSQVGWQSAPRIYSYYTNGDYGMGSYPNNSQKLVEDLIDLVDPMIDFSDYDANNDGYVDGIVVVHAGSGAERSGSPNDIWSHKWGILPRFRDGKIISSYSVQPEFWDLPGDMTIGVYCHELGHLLLGLPDLYDYDDAPFASRGLGLWSLMATGSWGGPGYMGDYPSHPDAWSRVQAGWVTPTVISTVEDDLPIPAVEDSSIVFKLWTDGGPIGDEYYLVENRQRTGYDTYLPSDGLFIYHVDEAVATGNDNQWYPGYMANGHYQVALEQADGNWDLEKNVIYNYGDIGDPYPGFTANRTFTSASTPSSDDYDGNPTYVVVADISNSGATMTADFNVTLGLGVLGEEEYGATVEQFVLEPNYPNPFNPQTTFSYTLPVAGLVIVEVYNVRGRKVRTLWSGARERGRHSVSWDGTDRHGAQASAGLYFYRVHAADQIKNGKMILLK